VSYFIYIYVLDPKQGLTQSRQLHGRLDELVGGWEGEWMDESLEESHNTLAEDRCRNLETAISHLTPVVSQLRWMT
jgi:hypothetical protein